MAKRKIVSEHDRIERLEKAVPELEEDMAAQVVRTGKLERAMEGLAEPAQAGAAGLPLVAGCLGGGLLLDPRGVFPDLLGPLLAAGGFEGTAAQAGVALSRAQTDAARAKRKADKIEVTDPAVAPPLPLESRAEIDAWKKQITDAKKLVDKALKDARDAKDKVFGAALAGGQFGKVRKDVEGAQKSFDEAEELLEEVDEDLDGWNGRRGEDHRRADRRKARDASETLKKAAKKVKDDLIKLKDAAAKITTPKAK